MRKIFARVSPNFPESFCAPFPHKFSPQRTWRSVFGVTSKIGPKCVFLQTLGAIFAGIFKDLALDFQGFYPIFQRFCPNFQGFCQNFWQIKTFGGTFDPPALPPPAPLQQLADFLAENRLGGLTDNKFLTKICFNRFWRWKLYHFYKKKTIFLMRL